MSQVAKVLAVKVRGSVFLGERDGEDLFSSDPAVVLRWLTDGWRTRFNQHRSKRHTYAHGFFDQAGADEQGRVLVPLALGCCLPYVRKKVVVRVASRGLLDAKAHCARAAL